ncbi:hypothetical protein V1264_022788 [Littorina saxatilis]|uniref:Uncharacterized protein n=2 Tax=Littorina saxatilis TaxID=31220 RepID=A0AAN9B6E4_9CAEN
MYGTETKIQYNLQESESQPSLENLGLTTLYQVRGLIGGCLSQRSSMARVHSEPDQSRIPGSAAGISAYTTPSSCKNSIPWQWQFCDHSSTTSSCIHRLETDDRQAVGVREEGQLTRVKMVAASGRTQCKTDSVLSDGGHYL